MARFKKMAIARPSDSTNPAVAESKIPEAPAKAVAAAARAAVRELPSPPPSELDRLTRLSNLTVTLAADNPELARDAIEAAALLRCQIPFTTTGQDRKIVGHIARFLIWSAFGDVVDPIRAFTRANVDEYLVVTATSRRRTLDQMRWVLYGTGRRLHPQQFPRAQPKTAPMRPRHPVASDADVRRLQALIPRLPARLGQRTQALLDLSYGAGARPVDYRSLRGTAVTSIRVDEREIGVVALPNVGGGVRQVPIVDPAISARLLELAATVGDGLLLAPSAAVAERNIANRVSEQLRSHGHPGVETVALRNRWILDLAQRVPAVLLQQLADVCDLRILADERQLLPQYDLRHAASILSEVQR